MPRHGHAWRRRPTFFELTTATAFSIFRDAGVAGRGARGRSRRTIRRHQRRRRRWPAAITNIDLDHTAQLGPTIAAIAFEKAGIIKPGMTIVTGERKPEALDVIAAACRRPRRHAAPCRIGRRLRCHPRRAMDGPPCELRTPARDYGRLTLALRGRHQIVNALVAARLLESLVAHAIAGAGDGDSGRPRAR